jgi:hypothetical protein
MTGISELNTDTVLGILGWCWQHNNITDPSVFPHVSNCLKLKNRHDLEISSNGVMQRFCVAIVASLCLHIGVERFHVKQPEKCTLVDIFLTMRPKKGLPIWFKWRSQIASGEAMGVGAWWMYKGRCIRNTQRLHWVPALVTSEHGDKYVCALFVNAEGKIHNAKDGCGLSVHLGSDMFMLQYGIPADLTKPGVTVEPWFNAECVDSDAKRKFDMLSKQHEHAAHNACQQRTGATYAFVQAQDNMVAKSTCRFSMVNKEMYNTFGLYMTDNKAVQEWWMCVSPNTSTVKASTTTTSIYSNLSGCNTWSHVQAWRHANEAIVYVPVCTFQYYEHYTKRKRDLSDMSRFCVAHQAHSKKRKHTLHMVANFIYLSMKTQYPMNKESAKSDTRKLFQLANMYMQRAFGASTFDVCKVFDLETPATNLEVEISTWFIKLLRNEVAHAHCFKLVVMKDGKYMQLCDPAQVMQHMLSMYKAHVANELNESRLSISAFGPYLGRHAFDTHNVAPGVVP